MGSNDNGVHREPWNKGKIVGQKAPLKVKVKVKDRPLNALLFERLRRQGRRSAFCLFADGTLSTIADSGD